MKFKDEAGLESYIRRLIAEKITMKNCSIYALQNRKAADILICRDGPEPALFFLEVKYRKSSHGRLGFGSRSGGGFQPEILERRPAYFESNLRWALASEERPEDGIILVTSDTIRKYVSGGTVGSKFNNIQAKLFRVDTVSDTGQSHELAENAGQQQIRGLGT